MNRSRQRCAWFLGLVLSVILARGQSDSPGQGLQVVRSISGQFIVTASPQFSLMLHRSDVAANTNLVRLEPALVVVAAERFKTLLWHELGLKPEAPWSGKIFLTLRPAHSLEDEVFIASAPFSQAWNYRLEMPDVLPCQRYARALATVLLMEIANRRHAVGADQAAEIPPWLAAGLAQQALADDAAKIILSSPAKKMDGLMQSRSAKNEHSLDPLAGARRTLQNFPALTFDQLNWPSDEQMDGNDAGVYLASAQLFVHELLGLKNGAAKCRDLLARLPDCRNWQSAFLAAFREDFPRSLDVEKWWAIRVVTVAAHDVGPRWPAPASRRRLTELLNVPVEFRSDSNALPVHAEISLQATLKNFEPARRDAVLRTKLRDLQLAEFRLAPPFNVLANGYRIVLADFLGEHKRTVRMLPASSQTVTLRRSLSVGETIEKLDDLDANRRAVEAKFDSLSRSLNKAAP
jgi:hypothetical protein